MAVELTPSERATLNGVFNNLRKYNERDLKSLEEKGLIYLVPAGYGLTDEGRDAHKRYFGP